MDIVFFSQCLILTFLFKYQYISCVSCVVPYFFSNEFFSYWKKKKKKNKLVFHTYGTVLIILILDLRIQSLNDLRKNVLNPRWKSLGLASQKDLFNN